MSATLDGMNTAQLQDLIARAEATIKAQKEKAKTEDVVVNVGSGSHYIYNIKNKTLKLKDYLFNNTSYMEPAFKALLDGTVSQGDRKNFLEILKSVVAGEAK